MSRTSGVAMTSNIAFQPFRDLTRRGWLRLGAASVAQLSLSQLLRAERVSSPKPAARSCVLFVLQGGPSQLDIWDLKPTAPAEVRGPFQPASTSVPGVQFVEHLPRLARVAKLFTIVRSMSHKTVFHHAAGYYTLSGQPPLRDGTVQSAGETDHPHLGAILALKRPGRRVADCCIVAEHHLGRVPSDPGARRRIPRRVLRSLRGQRRSE